ncbi:MAG TPA: cell division protein FtsK [Chloroflexi bacterium]|nr:cell division protein FtsK [Chloroflexota bacterium]
MAVKKTTASRTRAPRAKSVRQTTQRRPLWRRALFVVGRLESFSRPRSASQLVTLLLVLCGLASAGVQLYAYIARSYQPGLEAIWPAVLFVSALAARLSPWWRAELEAMTVDRGRNLLGSIVLVLVAISITGHFIGAGLGKGSSFLLLGPLGAGTVAVIALCALLLLALALLARIPLFGWIAALSERAGSALEAVNERETVHSAAFDPPPLEPYTADEASALEPEEPVRRIFSRAQQKSKPPIATSPAQPGLPPAKNGPLLPPIDIFLPAPKGPATALDVEYKSQRIQETLASFNVAARVVDHHVGPVVTQFDIQPDRGVKVKSITALQNDLALALAAPTIRMQAPVPGKSVIGIEIPNTAASLVSLRDLLESEKYRTVSSPLKVVLGKDVAGVPAVVDLAKMPHLLIAGATGSGKSVCVNALISCLLYANTPDQVRLMLVDPKMVELTVYNGVPHLLSPVVTNMDKVLGMLQWALREMERRYQMFSDATVRNIQRYNEKMETVGQKKLPFIVIIVDELADLMMISPEEVEDAICRLAQLARAAGIHLVIATQRPSVDVVTGLIKANFPARIAFSMSSQVDSRTILDTVGAEKLLGRGDMLYQPPDAPRPTRLQGANVTDHEIEHLVEFWKSSPLREAIQKISQEEFAAAEKAARQDGDELLGEAKRVVQEYKHASVSLLQRRLKIGYSRAARIVDQLEDRGIVGPADGSKQREVLEPGGDPDAA